MEDLTKQQLVLLTLLVSFVSSIATSISVVSLLNEEPQTITQTINRIVEKTIERVVPEEIRPNFTLLSPKSPLVASESDSTVVAVETNLPKMVTIWSGKTTGEEKIERGLGFAVSSDGLVVTDKNILDEGTEYSASFPDRKTYQAVKVYTDKNSDLAILKLRDEKGENATITPFVSFAPNEPKLGAPVIALGGKEGGTVYQGIVSEKIKTRLVTSILFKQVDRGGPSFGIDGKIIGMNVITADEERYTLSVVSILSAIESYHKEETAKTQ